MFFIRKQVKQLAYDLENNFEEWSLKDGVVFKPHIIYMTVKYMEPDFAPGFTFLASTPKLDINYREEKRLMKAITNCILKKSINRN